MSAVEGTKGRYVDVNGVHMYLETSGRGEPLVLLHGGFGAVHVFGAQVPAFAERYRVFVPDQRAAATPRMPLHRSPTRP